MISKLHHHLINSVCKAFVPCMLIGCKAATVDCSCTKVWRQAQINQARQGEAPEEEWLQGKHLGALMFGWLPTVPSTSDHHRLSA